MNAIGALIRRKPTSSISPSPCSFPPHEDTQRRQPFSNHELDSHQMPPGLTSTLNLEIQLPRTVRNKCGLSRPVYGNCYNS